MEAISWSSNVSTKSPPPRPVYVFPSPKITPLSPLLLPKLSHCCPLMHPNPAPRPSSSSSSLSSSSPCLRLHRQCHRRGVVFIVKASSSSSRHRRHRRDVVVIIVVIVVVTHHEERRCDSPKGHSGGPITRLVVASTMPELRPRYRRPSSSSSPPRRLLLLPCRQRRQSPTGRGTARDRRSLRADSATLPPPPPRLPPPPHAQHADVHTAMTTPDAAITPPRRLLSWSRSLRRDKTIAQVPRLSCKGDVTEVGAGPMARRCTRRTMGRGIFVLFDGQSEELDQTKPQQCRP